MASNQSLSDYDGQYAQSVADPAAFWARIGREMLTWETPFSDARAREGSFQQGDIRYFSDGSLNISVNCIDRHLPQRAKQTALVWAKDEPGEYERVTYEELSCHVGRWANLLRSLGVGKGDFVAVYLPMIPEAAYVMLACARIGAVHSVIFAGFSAHAVRDRVNDCKCRVIVTADEGLRATRRTPLKEMVDEAVVGCPLVQHVVMVKRTGAQVNVDAKTVLAEEALAKCRPYAVPEVMNAEDPSFVLYTSGSTGKPKGILHSTAGYLLYAAYTLKVVFDIREGDTFGCVADVGWITGHSYCVYGPLCLGTTSVLFESTPLYPDASRYWQVVEDLRLTQFYTAPTAIRALMKHGDDPVKKHDLTSLRTLGSVGEPINADAWNWYNSVVGGGRCQLVDTWWQTECGGFALTPISGITSPLKPGSATLPFLGIQPVLLDAMSGKEIEGEAEGLLAIKAHWPGVARTVLGDHVRYLNTYMNSYPGYYLTGDGAKRDADGYFWITGRVDDVLNKAGHRLGTAEIENALVSSHACVEAAVVAIPDDVRGQAIVAFVICAESSHSDAELKSEMKQSVRSVIGAIAVPDMVILVPGLPKTRSGKIMRRVLRKIAEGSADSLGDTSTLADPSVVPLIVEAFAKNAAEPPAEKRRKK